MLTLKENADFIARMAEVAMSLGASSVEWAVDLVVRNITDDAKKARKREGVFASEMTSEALEEWAFLGSVAYDVIANVSRPSTGNVREYVINATRELAAKNALEATK
jgi:hypothetical protein